MIGKLLFGDAQGLGQLIVETQAEFLLELIQELYCVGVLRHFLSQGKVLLRSILIPFGGTEGSAVQKQ